MVRAIILVLSNDDELAIGDVVEQHCSSRRVVRNYEVESFSELVSSVALYECSVSASERGLAELTDGVASVGDIRMINLMSLHGDGGDEVRVGLIVCEGSNFRLVEDPSLRFHSCEYRIVAVCADAASEQFFTKVCHYLNVFICN